MRYSLFEENEAVLLLGEGNFSFAVALHKLNLKINLTATCYESCVGENAAKENVEYLVNNGIRVFFNVDATKLTCHPILKLETFETIIFNFPHVGGKMKINKNRELLKQFFIAVENVLRPDGKLLITLCNGQGGTPADNPKRNWNDSWKVVEMAAHGNFMLQAVESFNLSLFQDYIVTGYRGLDKQFHTQGALTHIFKKSKEPNIDDIAPDDKIDIKFDTPILTWQDMLSIHQSPVKHCGLSFIHSPSFTFDMTFHFYNEFDTTLFFQALYNNAGCIIDDVCFLDSYKFPCNLKQSRTYRITYRSNFIPLYRSRVLEIHQKWITEIIEKSIDVTVCK